MPRAEAEQQSSSQTGRLLPLWTLPTAAPPPPPTSTDPSSLVPTFAAATVDTTAADTTNIDTTTVDEDTFEALGVPTALLRGVAEAGFERPTHCQSVAIPAILEGRDVLMQAPAGTGKTAAFAIGGLARLLSEKSGGTMLVLSPTKDLACQTHSMFHRLAKATHSREALATHVSYGGKQSDTADLNRAIRRSSRVALSATPGRALQHLERVLNPDNVRVLVVDEFDTMLDRFHDEVRDVTRLLPHDCHIIMVSATANADAVDVARRILRDPVEVSGENRVSASVAQYVVDCGDRDADGGDSVQRGALVELVQMSRARGRTIVFANSIDLVDSLAAELASEGISKVAAVLGRLPLEQRDAAVAKFRTGDVEVLVATDSVARGFDVQQVGTVFHFGVARDHASYVHRSSRCGRQGRRGVAVSIVAGDDERRWLRRIEGAEGAAIRPLPEHALDSA